MRVPADHRSFSMATAPAGFMIALDVDSVETLALDDRMRDRLDEAWPLADHRVPASRF